jgi:uncharacterized repeat protein (TIGR01451 family)
VAIISVGVTLPAITDNNTTIDGTTQTTLVGDSNSAVLGTGGNVGVDSVGLSKVNGPEIQLIAGVNDTIDYGLDLQGSNNIVRGLAIYGFGKDLAANTAVFSGNIHVAVTGGNALIEKNLIGTSAQSFSAPATGYTLGSGIVVDGGNSGTISNNLIGFQDGTGVVLRKSSSYTVTNNEVRGNDLHDFGSMDGISAVSNGDSHTIIGNLLIDNGACGIDNGRQDNLVIRNNTISGNGVSSGAGQSGPDLVETPGIRLGGSHARVEKNIIQANYGAGILVRIASGGNGNINPTQNTISQNSIFLNGSIPNRDGSDPTGQIGIDLEVAAQNTNQGTAPFITPNDGTVNATLPNDNTDYPVVTSAKVLGQVLTVTGYIGDTGPAATFGGATLEFFVGDTADSYQPDYQVVVSRADKSRHWEGKTYIGNCVADSNGSFICEFNSALAKTNVANLTFTATRTDGSTSEFGGQLPSVTQDSVSGKVFLDIGSVSASAVANNGVLEVGEIGIANAQVTLYDCNTNAVLGQSLTNSSGIYTINVPVTVVDLTPFCLQEVNAAQQVTYISTGASQTTLALSSTPSVVGTTYVRSTDTIKYTYHKLSNNGTLNFGDVPVNQFLTDGVKSGAPGNIVSYTHSFIAGTAGTVKFSLPGATANPAITGWAETLYTDTNCNGIVDSGEIQTVATPITVLVNQKICLVLKEFIPASASSGASNLAKVKADFVYTNAAPALATSYTRQDLTTVSDAALALKKMVRNVTLDGAGVPGWQVKNTAKSGEILEYQITYTNNGATNIATLVVNDATPTYTTFVSALANALPNSLAGCTKLTPASATPVLCSNPDVAGGAGKIEWKFTGSLVPGASGVVSFQVKVD